MEDHVLEQVDRYRIVELARNVADIVSITGEERQMAEYLGGEFAALGMQVEYQEVEEGRPNVIGTLKGTGGGATLMFCAHMDHFDSPQETVVEDDRIYGRGLVNMKAAFPCLVKAAQDRTEQVRAHAIMALYTFTEKSNKVIAICLAGLQDKSPLVRRTAGECLQSIVYLLTENGPPLTQREIDQIVPILIKALDDPDVSYGSGYRPVPHSALDTLKHFGPKGKQAVPALIDKLKSKEYAFRSLVLRTLAANGPEAIGAVPVIEGIREKEENLRKAAQNALEKIAGKKK